MKLLKKLWCQFKFDWYVYTTVSLSPFFRRFIEKKITKQEFDKFIHLAVRVDGDKN